jgi:FkbM family methyltransferase
VKLDWNYLKKRLNYLQNHRAFQKAPLPTISRMAIWGAHCLLKIPATIELPKWGCRFFLPPKLRKAGSTGIFITREDYEPELTYLDRLLAPGNVFVDGGANFGIYTVVASKLVGDSGFVLSFEPSPENFAILQRNVELNHMKNVKVFCSAISDSDGTTRLYHIDNAPNSYSLGKDINPATDYEEISTVTLDSVLQQAGLERVDFLKLDVEGAEELVLRGAESLFSRMRPIVLFEVSESATKRLGLSVDGAWKMLQELGYDLFTVGAEGELVSLDAPKLGNNIAMPKKK